MVLVRIIILGGKLSSIQNSNCTNII